MNLSDTRTATLKAARAVIDAAKAEDRELTEDEQSTVEGQMADVKQLDVQIKGKALVDSVMTLHTDEDTPDDKGGGGVKSAATLGEHFAKSIGSDKFAQLKTVGGYTVATPEFKAATDPQITTNAVYTPYLTEYDQYI